MQTIMEIIPKAFMTNSISEQSCKSYEQRALEHSNSIPGNLKYYDCPDCLNRGGTYRRNETGEIVFTQCKCMVIRRNNRNIESSGLKDLVERCTFDSFITAEPWQANIKNAALAFVENKNMCDTWFYIGGQVGAGKTHICTAIVGKFLHTGKTARYMRWRDDSVKLKAVVNDSAEYEEIISPFKESDVLYIDDFFKTERGKNPTTADVNLAFEIINYRYNNPRFITIISCERSVTDIVKIDEAVGSRIFERARNYCLDIQNDVSKNYRLRGVS